MKIPALGVAAVLLFVRSRQPAQQYLHREFQHDSPRLNYNSFSQFSVTNGTVDLIGNGFFDFYPSQGRYVDLDGSTGNAGLLGTNKALCSRNLHTQLPARRQHTR